jgi:hypothetical protein
MNSRELVNMTIGAGVTTIGFGLFHVMVATVDGL